MPNTPQVDEIKTDQASGDKISEVTCKQCGAHNRIKLSKNLPPEQRAKKHEQAGWQRHGRQTMRCPMCKKSAQGGDQSMTNQKHANTKGAANAPDMTAQQWRNIIIALEAYFDSRSGKYTNGYSDEKVASEIGVQERQVKNIRREAYGDIAVPQAVIDAEAAISETEHELAKLRERLSTLESRTYEARDKIRAYTGDSG